MLNQCYQDRGSPWYAVRIRVRSTTPDSVRGAVGVDLVGTLFGVAVCFGTLIRVAFGNICNYKYTVYTILYIHIRKKCPNFRYVQLDLEPNSVD